MRRFLTPAIVVSAVVTALAASAVVAHSNVSTDPHERVESLTVHLDRNVAVPSDRWVPVLNISLPGPGVYEVEANVRGGLAGTPRISAFIIARLWDTTSGTIVEGSERLVVQLVDLNSDEPISHNQTTPISELVRASRPTNIQLQAILVDGAGTPSTSAILSNYHGRTSIFYHQT